MYLLQFPFIFFNQQLLEIGIPVNVNMIKNLDEARKHRTFQESYFDVHSESKLK